MHTGYEQVGDTALRKYLWHLQRTSRDIHVVCGVVVTSREVLLYPFPSEICLADKLLSRSKTLIRLVESCPPVETPFPVPLDYLVLPVGISLQELHEIEGLLNLKSEVRILVHHLQGRYDDIMDTLVPAIIRSIHPSDILMGRLDDMDLSVLEDSPVLFDGSLYTERRNLPARLPDFQDVRVSQHGAPNQYAVTPGSHGVMYFFPVQEESRTRVESPVEHYACQDLQTAVLLFIGQWLYRAGPDYALGRNLQCGCRQQD